MKKLAILMSILLMISMTSCAENSDSISGSLSSSVVDTQAITTATEQASYKYTDFALMSAEEIVSQLTLEQKAAQMVQPAIYNVSEKKMKENCYGSILSKRNTVTYTEWQKIVGIFQKSAVESESGIPFLYGQDDVHGVNYCLNSVIFPHNIGIGAANNPELTYQMGLATADEAKLCHMLWNFAPCVAQSVDPRWGRTYESYGSDLELIKTLSTSYSKGLIDGGVAACAKHFFADGNVTYGTGEKSDVDRLIDRGDSKLSDDEIAELLSVYQAQIDTGVQTIMISHTSLNGLKMHENAQYIQYLKNEMGFKGFIVSDWDSVKNTSPTTYEQQVITSVNAGIDMLMEVATYDEAKQIIIKAVENGDISQERVDDAVTRIIQVKLDLGIFEDPFCERIETTQKETGSDEYRQLSEKLVEESLVLLKNDGDILPLAKGTSVYITGPAANNASAQCGGWTIDWNRSPNNNIAGATSILDGFKQKAAEYGITIITDKEKAIEADVVVLLVGEQAYAEWNGDSPDLELCGKLGLVGNEKAINEVRELNKPTIACIVAGRHVIIDDYYDDWDSVVMCYLPGSEGQGVANVLYGGADFSGRLPSPWYNSIDQIGSGKSWLEKGYGLSYNKD